MGVSPGVAERTPFYHLSECLLEPILAARWVKMAPKTANLAPRWAQHGQFGIENAHFGILFGASWRLFGDLGREKPKFQKLASRLDGSTIFKVSGPLGKPILAHLGAMLAHLGALLGYPGPSWRHLGTTWRQDGTQERQEANLQGPPWHKWTPPEAVRGRQARWRVIRQDPIPPSPDPSPCSNRGLNEMHLGAAKVLALSGRRRRRLMRIMRIL